MVAPDAHKRQAVVCVLVGCPARLKAVTFEAPQSVGAIVSGRLRLGFSPRKVIAILDRPLHKLYPGGLGLHTTLKDRTLLNVPSATLYRITRRTSWDSSRTGEQVLA